MATIDLDASLVEEKKTLQESWWNMYESGRIAAHANHLRSHTPGERAFKLAFCELVADGIYPSGRQIWKKLNRNVDRKVNLNGRECQWLASLREQFGIKPCVLYTPRRYRNDWTEWLDGRHGGPVHEYRLQRGPGGTLVACPEWINAKREKSS